MGSYIFRFPADVPEMTFETLAPMVAAQCSHPQCHTCAVKIGTTVTVRRHGAGLAVKLYDTVIALVYSESVEFPGPDVPSQATTEWLSKIIRDNGISGGCWRVRRRKSDGPGPYVARGMAGLLVLGNPCRQPVFGQTYRINRERIEAHRAFLAEWAERQAVRV